MYFYLEPSFYWLLYSRGTLDLFSREYWYLFSINKEKLLYMSREECKRTHHNLSQHRLQHFNVTWVQQQFDSEYCTIEQVIKLWFNESLTLKQILQIQSPLHYQTNILMDSGRAGDSKEHIIKKSLMFGFKICVCFFTYHISLNLRCLYFPILTYLKLG